MDPLARCDYDGPVENAEPERAAAPTPSDVSVATPRPERPYELPLYATGIVAAALLAAGFAIAFRAALAFVWLHTAGTVDVVAALGSAPWWLRVSLPGVGGLVAGTMTLLVAKAAGGHGVGEVMEAVVLGQRRLSVRVTLVKSLASWLAIASGGSLGREGPLIQFGGASGSFVGELLRLSPQHVRTLIAAGTAAGFASAYNTPIAAVLFVLEIVTGVAALSAVVPALVATAIATTLTRAVVGSGPIYGQRAFASRTVGELLLFAGLGIVVALGTLGFRKLLAFGERLFRRERLPQPWRAALGGTVAGAIIAVLPEVAGNGFEPLNAILDGRVVVGVVALLVIGKSVATTASVSSGSPGGVFTPMLLLGGALGFLYGSGLEQMGVIALGGAGGYALVAMSAAIAATTHAPVMAIVMVFELSGDYAIVLPLVLATAVATSLSRRLRRSSIYADELRARGVEWELTLEGRKIRAADR
ncbi:MAG: chloride channel protein [Deltaproteobacteria bacterium]|nr:chloride channel protein [Deltaproteobacteria bacterium]